MYLGIDLGTSNSAIVGNDGANLRLYKTSDGRDVLASMIYIDRRGNKFVGTKAHDQAILSPENVARGFKRLIGTATPVHFAASGLEWTPQEASAEILRALISQARAEVGDIEIEGAVITTPAAFNQMQSEATIAAAADAGMTAVGLLQEPVAAALASLEVATNKDGIFLVYDLGGGTFDVALVQSSRGNVTILAHEGVNMLGGQDFDKSIVNSIVRPWLLEKYKLPEDFQKDAKLRRLMKLALLKSEAAKIDLSTMDTTHIFVAEEEARAEDQAGEEIYIDIELTRSQLEQLTKDRIDETIALCRKILSDNGQSHDDIDRLVFIGGPSKMPSIRDRVPRELGIAPDLQTDPMTAVARGAAIYAESRTWDTQGGSVRKAARGSQKTSSDIGINYDFEARTSADEARIRVTAKSVPPGVRLVASNEDMWESGLIDLTDSVMLTVPLSQNGENRIQVVVTDGSGLKIENASTELLITKINASATGLPATQTIAVKTRRGDGPFAQNELDPLFDKGAMLPATGSKKFRASETLRASEDGTLNIEIFQKTQGVQEPELNLYVGSYQVTNEDLDQDAILRKGDEIVLHWKVDDNMVLSSSIEIPALGIILESHNFYVPSLGHRNYDGSDGLLLASNALNAAEHDLNDLADALQGMAEPEIAALRRKLERLIDKLSPSAEADEYRSMEEEARHIRQEISKLRHNDTYRKQVLGADLDRGTDLFAETVSDADPETTSRLKQLVETAETSIAGDDFETADRAVQDLRALVFSELRRQPDFILASFEHASEKRHLAIDKDLHDKIVVAGQIACDAGELQTVNKATFELYRNLAEIDGPSNDLSSLADLMSHSG